MSKKPLVEVKNLSVSFPVSGGIMGRKVAEVKAVDGISFSIGRSEIVGLVGESGCGKTTVGRAMINILKYIAPDVEVDGEILYHFDGEDVDFNKLHPRRMRKYRSRVQMIFQDPYASLNPRMTVAQIVEEPAGDAISFGSAYTPISPRTHPNGAKDKAVSPIDKGITHDEDNIGVKRLR